MPSSNASTTRIDPTASIQATDARPRCCAGAVMVTRHAEHTAVANTKFSG